MKRRTLVAVVAAVASLLVAAPVASASASASASANGTVAASATSFMTVDPVYPDFYLPQPTYLYSPYTGDHLNLVTDNGYLEVDASSDNNNVTDYLDVTPPQGQALHDGTYRTSGISPTRTDAAFDLIGEGGGCDQPTGTFTIHDIHTTPGGTFDRFSLTYLMYCYQKPDGGVYGQITINEPAPRDNVIIAPSVMPLPEVYLHTSLAAPLTVINAGSHRQSIRSVSVTGPGRDQFKIVTAGCDHAVLNPTAECQGELVYQPTRARAPAAAISINDTVSPHPQRIPVTANAYTRHTTWVLRDGNKNTTIVEPIAVTPRTAAISAGGTDTQINLQMGTLVDGESTEQFADLDAARGKTLQPGHTYTSTAADPSGPGLSVSANGVECAQPGSSFTLTQAKFAADGDLDYAAVAFTAKCGNREELVGSMAYRAPHAAPRLP